MYNLFIFGVSLLFGVLINLVMAIFFNLYIDDLMWWLFVVPIAMLAGMIFGSLL